ncbi:acetylcholinesterase precursor [Moniliophthora roreri]|nr:acetylcholinesterase precursor [Moniliophthora roreri]
MIRETLGASRTSDQPPTGARHGSGEEFQCEDTKPCRVTEGLVLDGREGRFGGLRHPSLQHLFNAKGWARCVPREPDVYSLQPSPASRIQLPIVTSIEHRSSSHSMLGILGIVWGRSGRTYTDERLIVDDSPLSLPATWGNARIYLDVDFAERITLGRRHNMMKGKARWRGDGSMSVSGMPNSRNEVGTRNRRGNKVAAFTAKTLPGTRIALKTEFGMPELAFSTQEGSEGTDSLSKPLS